jgi:hypothetical protein
MSLADDGRYNERMFGKDDAMTPTSKKTGAFDEPLELWLDDQDVLTTPLLPGLELKLADVFKGLGPDRHRHVDHVE